MTKLTDFIDIGYGKADFQRDLHLFIAIAGYWVYQYLQRPGPFVVSDFVTELKTAAVPMIAAKLLGSYFARNPNKPQDPTEKPNG